MAQSHIWQYMMVEKQSMMGESVGVSNNHRPKPEPNRAKSTHNRAKPSQTKPTRAIATAYDDVEAANDNHMIVIEAAHRANPEPNRAKPEPKPSQTEPNRAKPSRVGMPLRPEFRAPVTLHYTPLRSYPLTPLHSTPLYSIQAGSSALDTVHWIQCIGSTPMDPMHWFLRQIQFRLLARPPQLQFQPCSPPGWSSAGAAGRTDHSSSRSVPWGLNLGRASRQNRTQQLEFGPMGPEFGPGESAESHPAVRGRLPGASFSPGGMVQKNDVRVVF